MWSRARAGHVNVGDAAPSLTVKRLEDKTPVELGSLWNERPVVLVFGSYT
jgi:peroxiredoxin